MLCLVKKEERADISTPPYSMSGKKDGKRERERGHVRVSESKVFCLFGKSGALGR